jgi:hypothetical protein
MPLTISDSSRLSNSNGSASKQAPLLECRRRKRARYDEKGEMKEREARGVIRSRGNATLHLFEDWRKIMPTVSLRDGAVFRAELFLIIDPLR